MKTSERTKPSASLPQNAAEPLLPYEKFMSTGAESLSDAELLAVILRTGTKDASAVELGRCVLQSALCPVKGLRALNHLTLAQLQAYSGIGEVKAIQLKCVAELSKRMAKEMAAPALSFDSPDSVARFYMEDLRHLETERTILVSVDGKGHMLDETVLTTGTVNASLVSPREVFLHALDMRAVGVLLLHNHPSGDPTPSHADIDITRKTKKAGELLDIPLLDHVIIGDLDYYSFKESGLL